MEPTLRVGCPMWANRDWVGTALPPGTTPGHELEAYSQLLLAVEGNTTFYALPDEATAARWRASVPDDFRFCFKLPRRITHERRLRHCAHEVAQFMTALAPLHDVMGPTSVQLPASFGPPDLEALDEFLDELSPTLPWAVEVRHPGFFVGGDHEQALDQMLWRHDVNRVIFDTRAFFAGPATTREEVEAVHQKPRLPVRPTRTASAPVVRFLGQSDRVANPEFWNPWITKLAQWCDDGAQPCFFFHTPDNRLAPQLAIEVSNAVSELTPAVTATSLPEFGRTLFSAD